MHLVLGVMAVLAAVTSARTMAMDEQQGPPPAAVAPDAPKAQAQDGSGSSKSDEGTEIRVPGLGKLGTLPKMDFGLELLYGAAESKSSSDSDLQNGNDKQQDMIFHGSVRHRF